MRALHFVTNNAYDSLVLTEDARVVSEWTCHPRDVIQFCGAAQLDEWDVQDAGGLKDSDGRPLTVEDYGEVVATDTDESGMEVPDHGQFARRLELWAERADETGRAFLLDIAARWRS